MRDWRDWRDGGLYEPVGSGRDHATDQLPSTLRVWPSTRYLRHIRTPAEAGVDCFTGVGAQLGAGSPYGGGGAVDADAESRLVRPRVTETHRPRLYIDDSARRLDTFARTVSRKTHLLVVSPC